MQSPSLRSTLHELCYRLQKQAMLTAGKPIAPHFELTSTQTPLAQTAQNKNGLRDRTQTAREPTEGLHHVRTQN